MRIRLNTRLTLVMTFVVALVASFYSARLHHQQQRLNAIRYLESKGRVRLRTQEGFIPTELDDAIRMQSSVDRVYLTHDSLSELELRMLKRLEAVPAISLNSSNFDDSMVDMLSGLENLKELHLNGTSITADGLCILADNHAIQILTLNNTEVGDECIEVLIKMHGSLRRLELADTNISPQGAYRLQSCMKTCNIYYLQKLEEELTGKTAEEKTDK